MTARKSEGKQVQSNQTKVKTHTRTRTHTHTQAGLHLQLPVGVNKGHCDKWRFTSYHRDEAGKSRKAQLHIIHMMVFFILWREA